MNVDKYFETIKSYRLLANHDLGQNFLIDQSLARKIVDLLEIDKDDQILEIGPGAGSLSYFLNESKAECTLMDIDERFVLKLQNDFKENKNIKPILFNALDADLQGYSKIIGNLPYYITSQLILNVIVKATACKKAVFMIQKEAYDRLISLPNSKDYGPLSILLAFFGKVKKEFTVSPGSFSPAPHVESVVFSYIFFENRNVNAADFYRILSALFLHRRKTIYSNISLFLQDKQKAKLILEKAEIDGQKRPEQLSLSNFFTIYSLLKD